MCPFNGRTWFKHKVAIKIAILTSPEPGKASCVRTESLKFSLMSLKFLLVLAERLQRQSWFFCNERVFSDLVQVLGCTV